MEKLSPRHYFFFLLCVSTISLTTYTSIFITEGGRDSWLWCLISCLIFAFISMYVINSFTKGENYDLKQIFIKAYSNSIGKLLLFIFSIGLFIVSLESISIFPSSLHTNIFIKTPIWYASLLFAIPILYLVTRNLKTLIIVITSISFISLICNIVLLLIFLPYTDLINLLPILGDGLTLGSINTVLMILGSLSSFMVCLPYLKYLSSNKGIKKNSVFAIIFISFIVFLTFISSIGYLNPLRASNIFYPQFLQAHSIQISDFLEIGELLYLLKLTFNWFGKFILAYYGIYILYEDVLRTKKWFPFMYVIVSFFLAIFITSKQLNLFWLLKYMQYVLLIPLLLIPLIAAVINNFKTRKI